MSESEFQKPPREDDPSPALDPDGHAESSPELVNEDTDEATELHSTGEATVGDAVGEQEDEYEYEEEEYGDEEDEDEEDEDDEDEVDEDEASEADEAEEYESEVLAGEELEGDEEEDEEDEEDERGEDDEVVAVDDHAVEEAYEEVAHDGQDEDDADEIDVVVASEDSQGQPSFQPTVAVLPPPSSWVAPSGTGNLLRPDADNNTVIDALAGRTSVFGLDCAELTDSIRSSAGNYLGDGSAFLSDDTSEIRLGLRDAMADLLGPGVGDLADSLFLTASADFAVETAILLARRRRSERAFRTVALVGSDHGRTALCRTASGRPELHEDLGPMMAGFAHVPVGDFKALDVTVDEQTACVLISPNLWSRGGEVLDANYLNEVRRVCDERGVLLAVDETQVVFGSTGHPLAINSIAEVRPDIVALSSGLFAGMPGGITLASSRVTGEVREEASHYPLLAEVVSWTLREISNRRLLGSVSNASESLAVELAQRLSRFEFVRDVQVLGLSIGIETDLDSAQLVKAAAQRRLRVETAGDTAIRIQLPLALTDDDQNLLLEAMEETFSSIQLETADLSA